MLTIAEKTQRRRRPQIFNDHSHAAADAALAKENWLAHWVKYLASAIRKVGGRNRHNG
jgi:hypothetical protein